MWKPLARALAAAPTTPPAGPESTVRTGSRAAAESAVMPPLDCMTKMLGRQGLKPGLFWARFHSAEARLYTFRRRSGQDSSRFSRYRCITGCRYALITTVEVRSYSRNSGRIW